MYQEQSRLVIKTCPEDQLLILFPQNLSSGRRLNLYGLNIHGFTVHIEGIYLHLRGTFLKRRGKRKTMVKRTGMYANSEFKIAACHS